MGTCSVRGKLVLRPVAQLRAGLALERPAEPAAGGVPISAFPAATEHTPVDAIGPIAHGLMLGLGPSASAGRCWGACASWRCAWRASLPATSCGARSFTSCAPPGAGRMAPVRVARVPDIYQPCSQSLPFQVSTPASFKEFRPGAIALLTFLPALKPKHAACVTSLCCGRSFQARAVRQIFPGKSRAQQDRSHRRYFTHRLDAQLPFDFMQYMELSMVHPLFCAY